MKKKIRSRLNSSLFTLSEKVAFRLTNVICFIGLLIAVHFFYKNYTMSLTKLNEEKIATITFKYKTAQRRFEEGTIWDRLKQESPVYNGDTIRTADLSEATLHFNDGNEMNLTDNTMTQVFLNEDKQLRALLSGGSITIDTTNAQGSQGVVLSYNGVEIELENGTMLNATGDESQDFSVQVFNGEATVTNADGTKNSVTKGDTLAITSSGAPKATLSITSPLPNAKILNHSQDPIQVPVEWKLTGTDEKFSYTLEIATDAGFKNIEQTINTSETSATVLLSNGQKYYRVLCNKSDNTIAAQVKGKVQVIESLIPRLVAPVNEFQFKYRKLLPAIRFIWSEAKFATSYELVIANNPAFANPVLVQRSALPSSIVTSIGNGKWYWKVTPFYTINNIGLDGESETGYFEVIQQGRIPVPVLLFPSDGAFLNTVNASKNTNFSWKLDRESVQYNMIIADNPELTNPLHSFTTDINYYPFDASKVHLKNGNWYWAVCAIDEEGNKSEYSKPRSFYAVDGEIIQRTIYPPDQYKVAQNLVSDIRFTWKSNLPFDKRFEVSKDPQFTKIAYKQFIRDNTISGVNLPVGEYYWRIVSSSPDRDFASPVKTLTVLGPLDAPVCIIPDVNKRALVRPFTPFDFTWAEAEGADYYKLTIKNPRTDDVIFEQNLIEDTKLSINMEDIPEGYYNWTIQSFSYETELSSRRTGKIGEANFEMKKIHPVELVKPANNTVLDGVQAILNPGTITWASRDEVSKSRFVLTRTDVKPAQIISDLQNPERTVRLPRLHSGTYTWTVNADSVDGYDLSPAEPYRFTITPVPNLESAKNLLPANRAKLDGDYFKASKKISFSWSPVKDATHYIIRVQKRDGTLLMEQKVKETHAEFTDLKELSRGNFTWSVEAIRCISDGTTLQESVPTKSTFIVDLPQLKATKLKEGVMYGK